MAWLTLLTGMSPASIHAQSANDSVKRKSIPMQTVVPQRPQPKTADGSVLVQGTITDPQGSPLPAATIYVRETKGGAIADNDGRFSVSIPSGQRVTIDFSFLGMKTLSRTYDGKRTYTNQSIVLQEDNKLDEVVVTGLFDYKSSTFTGSTSSYSQDELKQVTGSNVLKAIQALDPAFVVDMNSINGSNPNALQDITIRGNASFAGLQGDYSGNPNAPLFILDGFEATQQQVFDLDINRIKSVTILKDGAAKAIYGSKASNGVVVVETVQPEVGKLRITYTGDLNIEVPDLTSYNLCNAQEKLQVEINAGRYTSSSPYYQALLNEQRNEIAAGIARGIDKEGGQTSPPSPSWSFRYSMWTYIASPVRKFAMIKTTPR